MSKDITKMTVAELEAYIREKKAEERKTAMANGEQARQDLEAYCQKKYGCSLKAIGLITKKPSKSAGSYQNPETKEVYYYTGFGKIPAWLKGVDDKPKQNYRVNEAS